jgi:hypothetical protein
LVSGEQWWAVGGVVTLNDEPASGLEVEAHLALPAAYPTSHTCARVGCSGGWAFLGSTRTQADGSYVISADIEDARCDETVLVHVVGFEQNGKVFRVCDWHPRLVNHVLRR